MPRWLVPPLAVAAALLLSASASAHPSLSPPIVQTGQTQTFTLAVPTEKAGVTTTEVELTLPDGFDVEAFVPAEGWKRSGEGVVTWTGGAVPTGEAALLRFVGGPEEARTYDFTVRQTYSDGSVSEWEGEEVARVEARSSLGGGGNTPALVLAILGVVLGAVALLLRAGEGRELA
jgi:uncharacterized protein YcnI